MRSWPSSEACWDFAGVVARKPRTQDKTIDEETFPEQESIPRCIVGADLYGLPWADLYGLPWADLYGLPWADLYGLPWADLYGLPWADLYGLPWADLYGLP